MRRFEYLEALSSVIGIQLPAKFPDAVESDWTVIAGGLGRSGESEDRWLVTFVCDKRRNDSEKSGYLVAYAIGVGQQKTGEALLIAGPRSWDDDALLLRNAQVATWWSDDPIKIEEIIELHAADGGA